jgi:hypothetical protein
MRDRTSLCYLEEQPQIDELKLHQPFGSSGSSPSSMAKAASSLPNCRSGRGAYHHNRVVPDARRVNTNESATRKKGFEYLL